MGRGQLVTTAFIVLWGLWLVALIGSFALGLPWKWGVWGWFWIQEGVAAWRGYPTLSGVMQHATDATPPDRDWWQDWNGAVVLFMLLINGHAAYTYSSMTGPWEQWWMGLVLWPFLGATLWYHWRVES